MWNSFIVRVRIDVRNLSEMIDAYVALKIAEMSCDVLVQCSLRQKKVRLEETQRTLVNKVQEYSLVPEKACDVASRCCPGQGGLLQTMLTMNRD